MEKSGRVKVIEKKEIRRDDSIEHFLPKMVRSIF